MQKISSILNRSFKQNPTLQKIFFEQKALLALEELYRAHHLDSWKEQLTPAFTRQKTQLTLHLRSPNALLLTHLRLQKPVLERAYLDLVRAVDPKVSEVRLKLRTG